MATNGGRDTGALTRHELTALVAAIIGAGELSNPNTCELRIDSWVRQAGLLLDEVDISLRETHGPDYEATREDLLRGTRPIHGDRQSVSKA